MCSNSVFMYGSEDCGIWYGQYIFVDCSDRVSICFRKISYIVIATECHDLNSLMTSDEKVFLAHVFKLGTRETFSLGASSFFNHSTQSRTLILYWNTSPFTMPFASQN